MPRVIDAPTEDLLDLASVVDLLDSGDFDARDEDNFASWGQALKKLGNNRAFLADLMIDELKQRCSGQMRGNQYSAQVIMLHVSRNGYLIRANLWPAEADSVVRQSGTDPFFYHLPHDHNFSFLTVGYLGPGYWSDYYEYDYEQVAGVTGEAVDLKFIERTSLSQGKVMLYRAHRDIHLQLPADSMSVSLNIMEHSHATAFRDQYRFDIPGRSIAGILTHSSIEPLLMIAAHHGSGNGMDLVTHFADSHPSERIRWCALRARAGTAATLDERIALLEEGTRDKSALVAGMARRMVDQLERGRQWIETAPAMEHAAA